MKIYRKNWFNRLFHRSELKAQEDEYLRVSKRLRKADELAGALNLCGNLMKMLALHKEMWTDGFQNRNTGPGPMFRTKNILTMQPEHVYLGNIFGLFTHPIPYWEKRKDERFGQNGFGIRPETKIYKQILRQYRKVLMTNLTAVTADERKWMEEYETVVMKTPPVEKKIKEMLKDYDQKL